MPLPNAVANPIINDPFAEPSRHYDFSGGAPALLDGRRSAGYLRGNRAHGRPGAQQDTLPLALVNATRTCSMIACVRRRLRRNVKRLAASPSPGVVASSTTISLVP